MSENFIHKEMQRMKWLIPALLFFICQGCSFVAKLGHGTQKPKIETSSSVSTWLKKNGLISGIVATSSPEDYYFFSPRFLSSIFVFDKTGRFYAIGYTQAKKCVRDIHREIAGLKPLQQGSFLPDSFIVYQYYEEGHIDNVKEKSKSEIKKYMTEFRKTAKVYADTLFLDYSFVADKIRTSTGQKFHTDPDANADFTLILPFAKFNGNRVQVKEIRKYYKAALNNSHAKINIIFLNLDMQEWWGNEWNSKIRIEN